MTTMLVLIFDIGSMFLVDIRVCPVEGKSYQITNRSLQIELFYFKGKHVCCIKFLGDCLSRLLYI